MQTIPDVDALRRQSRRVVASAAAAAGIKIKPLHDLAELEELNVLISGVWGTKERMVSTELLRALAHAGNYVVGAFAHDDLVGAGVGFLGLEDETLLLHSHIVGVNTAVQGRKIGYAIKQHQRTWCLERGIATVHWTFDPLVRRNAYFNVTKLGARAAAYYPAFYGSMSDGINAGDETDRMLVEWDLASPAAVEASLGLHEWTEAKDLVAAGAAFVLEEHDGSPVTTGRTADVLVCATPSDIIELRERDLELALSWRKAMRATLGATLGDGYAVSGFTRDGCYILTKP